MPKKGEIPVSFKLDPSLIQQLDLIAERECRTRSGTVRIALKRFVAEHNKSQQIEKRQASATL